MSSPKSTDSANKKFEWVNLIIFLLAALLLRWLVIEPRWIPSGSMLPTLEIKERILVEKVSPKINKFANRSETRQSIIVFKPPISLIEAGFDKNSALIKRIIGIPGDQIEIKEGKLIINGKSVSEPWLESPMKYEIDLFEVPEDSYWVLGDNRNNSLDSHIWGALPAKNVIGKAVFRYWPLNKIGSIRFSPSRKA